MNFIKIFKNFDLENIVTKIAGEGKLKAYDESEKIGMNFDQIDQSRLLIDQIDRVALLNQTQTL